MAVAEEVPVEAIAGGAGHDPGPGALFAFGEGEVVGVEEGAGGVVNERPAGAGDEALADGLAGVAAEGTVEGTGGALEVFGIGEAGMPGNGFAVEGEGEGEVVGGEAAVVRAAVVVGEMEGGSLEGEGLAGAMLGEVGHGQAAIEEDEGGMVFEVAVRGPLHADELGGEDGEASIAELDDGGGIGHRVVGGFGRLGLRAGGRGDEQGGREQAGAESAQGSEG